MLIIINFEESDFLSIAYTSTCTYAYELVVTSLITSFNMYKPHTLNKLFLIPLELQKLYIFQPVLPWRRYEYTSGKEDQIA